jgi:hypothetical protein
MRWKRGFDETFGFIGGGHNYMNWTPNERQYTLALSRNGKPVEVTEHLTLALGNEASAFIRRHTGAPWFLFLAFNAPHTPVEIAGRIVPSLRKTSCQKWRRRSGEPAEDDPIFKKGFRLSYRL